MAPEVNCFDEEKLKLQIKDCPKEVQDYIEALKRSNKNWEQLTNDCVKRLKSSNKFIHTREDMYRAYERGLGDGSFIYNDVKAVGFSPWYDAHYE